MSAEAGFRHQNGAAGFPRVRARRCLAFAILVVAGLVVEVRSETGSEPEPQPGERQPWTADFPELAAAYRPLDEFVSGNTVLLGDGDRAGVHNARRLFHPFPAESRILAFEENSHFICATGDASHLVGASQPAQDHKREATFVRRFLLLKPSLLVVDDFVSPGASGESVRWMLGCRSAPTVSGGRLRIAGEGRDLVCETLWPAGAALQKAPQPENASGSLYQIAVEPEAGVNGARWLHVFELRGPEDDGAPAKAVLENNDGCFEVTISTSDRTYRLSLPPPGAGAGRIAVEAADGKALIARRPLPGGVLPHGPEGIRLIERWDRAYRDGRRAPWDARVTAPALQEAVENGVLKPCRTVVLGCGTGTNAIYLAGKGFDVTAIDVAPTGLGIAESKAEKAGVRVKWLLADVLALPDLEPFDLIFDRGCYHNVRYVDAAGFVESIRRLSRPGTRFLVLSLNRDGPPGVREHHMRGDFSSLFDFQWLRTPSDPPRGDRPRGLPWSVLLRRKSD